VDVRSIGGLGPAANAKLAAEICAVLETREIPPARVYLNFTDVSAGSWGHGGGTFA
jgi:phenylpyruvate tautomerase PptA (4-oxalocrotonate tautomerase family)